MARLACNLQIIVIVVTLTSAIFAATVFTFLVGMHSLESEGEAAARVVLSRLCGSELPGDASLAALASCATSSLRQTIPVSSSTRTVWAQNQLNWHRNSPRLKETALFLVISRYDVAEIQPLFRAVEWFGPGSFHSVVVVVEPLDLPVVLGALPTWVEVKEMQPFLREAPSKTCEPGGHWRLGYLEQQLHYLEAYAYTLARYILFVDGDLLPVQGCFTDWWESDGRVRWARMDRETHGLHLQKALYGPMERALWGIDPAFEYMVRLPLIASREQLVGFANAVQARHRMSVAEWVQMEYVDKYVARDCQRGEGSDDSGGFSQFNALGAYLHRIDSNGVEWLPGIPDNECYHFSGGQAGASTYSTHAFTVLSEGLLGLPHETNPEIVPPSKC